MSADTLTARDLLPPNSVTANVSTFSTRTKLAEWNAYRVRTAPAQVESTTFLSGQTQTLQEEQLNYLISNQAIRTKEQPPDVSVSPAWFGSVKKSLKDLIQLPLDWDTYGGVPADPRMVALAEDLIYWFAIDGVPPPDVFATSDGGIQFEWHIRGIDATIALSHSDEESGIYFHDLHAEAEPWSAPLSERRLQAIRQRLLEEP